MANLAQQIKSAAKTANSRIRRSGGKYKAEGAGALSSGYFTTGSAKLTTAQKRERLRDLRRFIKETDTPQTKTARRTREKRAKGILEPTKKPKPPRTRSELTQRDIVGWSRKQLIEMIRREGKTANSRLERIYQSGNENLLPSVYRTRGKFSLATADLTENELQLKFLQIREFLSHDFTLQGLKDRKSVMMERMGFDEEDDGEFQGTLEMIDDLVQKGLNRRYLESNALTISEYAREGLDAREIYDLMLSGFEDWKEEQKREQERWMVRHRKKRF